MSSAPRSPVTRVMLYYLAVIAVAIAILQLITALGIHLSLDRLRLLPGAEELTTAVGRGRAAAAPSAPASSPRS